jgi:hypothetical protein
MGLFDWFARKIRCPECGEERAVQPLLGRIRCPNRACGYFDPGLASSEGEGLRSEPPRVQRSPGTREGVSRTKATPFNPGRAVEVHYKNYRGEEKTFSADARSLRRRHKHISLRVSPSGVRIALARQRILNLPEVDAILSNTPTTREQWVMAYHRKRGTTSTLLQRLQAKYPDW